ncbi:MAG: NAD-dependent deacylase [Cyanobacteria bacterium SZAS TMP-1]|nr:NAD-dependent deacylase [Cyanobacteria bacterium SZAS TMP-1]
MPDSAALPDEKLLSRAASYIKGCKRLVVLTGAGVSKESGIPTFRDKLTGLWEGYDPGQLATPEGFLKNPPLVWKWYDWRRQMVSAAEPNDGHRAIAQLQKLVPTTVVTQNVDRLHQRAGSENVLELHGNILTFRCFERGHQALDDVASGLDAPPVCQCGSLLRPNVVWFGEALPQSVLADANKAAKLCDLMFVVGTSALVQPAASLPYIALDRGAIVVEVNPNETPLSEDATLFLSGASGLVMPQLVRLFEALN